MKEQVLMMVRRRDLLRFAIASTAAASAETLTVETAVAEPLGGANKRRARYQADSAEIRDFYRVCSYPTR